MSNSGDDEGLRSSRSKTTDITADNGELEKHLENSHTARNVGETAGDVYCKDANSEESPKRDAAQPGNHAEASTGNMGHENDQVSESEIKKRENIEETNMRSSREATRASSIIPHMSCEVRDESELLSSRDSSPISARLCPTASSPHNENHTRSCANKPFISTVTTNTNTFPKEDTSSGSSRRYIDDGQIPSTSQYSLSNAVDIANDDDDDDDDDSENDQKYERVCLAAADISLALVMSDFHGVYRVDSPISPSEVEMRGVRYIDDDDDGDSADARGQRSSNLHHAKTAPNGFGGLCRAVSVESIGLQDVLNSVGGLHKQKRRRAKRPKSAGTKRREPLSRRYARMVRKQKERRRKLARRAIMLTTVFMLTTCFALVGVTLSMAPKIDEWVRETFGTGHINTGKHLTHSGEDTSQPNNYYEVDARPTPSSDARTILKTNGNLLLAVITAHNTSTTGEEREMLNR